MIRLARTLIASAVLVLALSGAALAQEKPTFQQGFAALASQIPDIVGQPVEDEHYGANGDSLQQTTTGLMVWRKADNWTAFTDGATTWVNGPAGLQSRVNDQRFAWEAAGPPAGSTQPHTLSLASDAFQSGGVMPAECACDGENASPPLSWDGAPSNTGAFALVMEDPDTPRGVLTHWVAYDLPADARGLPGDVAKTEEMEMGGSQGPNDHRRPGYTGPCPGPGSFHRYIFVLYALDAPLGLAPGASKQELLSAADGHVLDQAVLFGIYRR